MRPRLSTCLDERAVRLQQGVQRRLILSCHSGRRGAAEVDGEEKRRERERESDWRQRPRGPATADEGGGCTARGARSKERESVCVCARAVGGSARVGHRGGRLSEGEEGKVRFGLVHRIAVSLVPR